jgi:hypothetical protein
MTARLNMSPTARNEHGRNSGMMRLSKMAAHGAVAAALVAGALAAPAHAAGATRAVVADFAEPYAFTVDCSQFGAYAFDIAVEGEQRVKVTTVTDADGTLRQTVIHSSFAETDTNSVTSASLPLAGTMHEVIDHIAGTRTVRGNIARGTQPGAGTYFEESGQIVFAGGVGDVLFAAGRHDAIEFGGVNPALCAALAAT